MWRVRGYIQKFRTESITKYTLTFGTARWEATQRVMAEKLTRLTHKIAIQLHLVAESCTIRRSRSRRPVRKLLVTPSYVPLAWLPVAFASSLTRWANIASIVNLFLPSNNEIMKLECKASKNWHSVRSTVSICSDKYEGVSKSFRTGHLERELQMVQLSATVCSCNAILWVSLVSFAAITLCVVSQWLIPKVSVYFVTDSLRKLLDTPLYMEPGAESLFRSHYLPS
jgi:hypothetical protein